MKNTLVDFWYLIWQERPVSIVMLTKLKEGGKSKCRQYWPNTVTEQEKFGPFIVLLKSTQTYPDFVIRQLCITVSETNKILFKVHNVLYIYIYIYIYRYKMDLMIVIH